MMKRMIRLVALPMMLAASTLSAGFCEDQFTRDVKNLVGIKLMGGFGTGEQAEITFALMLTEAELRYYDCNQRYVR